MQLTITDYEGDEGPAECIYQKIKDRKEEAWPERKSILECIYSLGIMPGYWALESALLLDSKQMIEWIYKRNPDIREIDQNVVTNIIMFDIKYDSQFSYKIWLKGIGVILKTRSEPLNITVKYMPRSFNKNHIPKIEKLFEKYGGKFEFVHE